MGSKQLLEIIYSNPFMLQMKGHTADLLYMGEAGVSPKPETLPGFGQYGLWDPKVLFQKSEKLTLGQKFPYLRKL